MGTHLEDLSEDECWSRLRDASVGRLAVVVGSQPDIFPVNYVVDGRELVIRTEPGTKLAGAIIGQLVALEIDFLDHERRHASGHIAIQQHHEGSVVEVRDDDKLDFERISFKFTKHGYGDLIKMIGVLNSYVL